ncbi:hypothetical protein [Thauera sp. WH-1]|uniref:hypothetical protein n=1 Tax=Thauera sp. WH-1 TaxID=3398230 RepID=UPI0039FBB62D
MTGSFAKQSTFLTTNPNSIVGMLMNTVKCSTFTVVSGEAMATVKTATLTFRIDPCLKEALRIAADQELRSIANMVEFLIRDYCERRGIAIPYSEEAKNNNGARS